MNKKKFRSILSILLIFSLVFMLPIAPLQNVEAATKKIKIKYVTNGGTFKSNLFKDKKTVTLKVKKGKQRGDAPNVKRKNYVFAGWYTKKKGGIKYTANTKITKKTTLYARWIRKYKVSDKYTKILSTTSYTTIKDLEKDTGSLKLIDKEKSYPYMELYKAKNGDIYSVEPPSEIECTTFYFVTKITTKAKNVVNIKKATRYKRFLKKLGIRKYSKIKKNKLLNFSFVLETVNLVFDDPDDSDLQYVRWNFNANSKNKITPKTEINFWLTSNWDY